MADRLRTATKLNLRPETRLALEALALDLGCSMVQAVERLLTLPHSQLVALCKADQPAATETAPVADDPYDQCLVAGCIYTRGHRGKCFQPGDVVPAATALPTPEQDAIARDVGCYIDPEYVAKAAREPAPCIHTLNHLGHCTRCGERPKDKL